jgi:hypothetical protein
LISSPLDLNTRGHQDGKRVAVRVFKSSGDEIKFA